MTPSSLFNLLWFAYGCALNSRTYVKKILSKLPASQLHLSTPIRAAKSIPISINGTGSGQTHQVELTTASGETQTFDHVILACHTDTTVGILEAGGGTTAEEARILGSFGWNKNEAVLHCDERVRCFSLCPRVHVCLRRSYSLVAYAGVPAGMVVLELPHAVGHRRSRAIPAEREPGFSVSFSQPNAFLCCHSHPTPLLPTGHVNLAFPIAFVESTTDENHR